jgi:xylan 1,4-beta-xylosidase
MEVRQNDLQFFWKASAQEEWTAIGPVLDAGVISDEGGRGEHGSFTGAFAGMFAFDISGSALPADFDRFRYEAIPQ